MAGTSMLSSENAQQPGHNEPQTHWHWSVTCHAVLKRMSAAMQPVDAETQKSMMAFYHKKQEEQKVQDLPLLYM